MRQTLMKSNLMIKVIAGVLLVVVIAVVIGGKDKKGENNSDLVSADAGPEFEENGLDDGIVDDIELDEKFGIETDTPDETMHTLITEMEKSHKEVGHAMDENKLLKAETARLLKMEKSLQDRMDSKVYRTQQEMEVNKQEMERGKVEMESLISKLKNQVSKLADTNQNRPKGNSDYGFEVNDFGMPIGLTDDVTGKAVDPNEIVWVEPLDAMKDKDDPDKLVFPELDSSGLDDFAKVAGVKGQLDKAKLIRAYTIPANATLLGSVAMTAILGRIPAGGAVTDPFPFKILIGQENLSSNGIDIPGVTGIKMSGKATGDWTLSCVTGAIYSMTFTFDDGIIRTIPDPEDGGENTKALAWFSDEWGIPCVTGIRITNAVSYLSSRVGLSAASTYANAKAAAELTTTVDQGSTTTALTGDPSVLAKNRAISEGINEVTDWLDERQENSFDAIYVEPGTRLELHITQQLEIDYNPEGRKVNHYAKIQGINRNRID